jgi:XRE family transcriptional regulator of biofilm formation
MSIGQRIQRLRVQRNMSQTDLAERSGVKQSLISRIERGSRPNPTADVLRRLARTLGCTTDYLVGMHEQDEEDDEVLQPIGAVA